MKTTLIASAILFVTCSLASGQLMIDFNSTNQDGGPHNHPGFEPYDAGHEVPADFDTKSYAAFGTSVTVTPAWPNTTDARVQQMIDRGPGNDATWLDTTAILIEGVTDFLGIDTRTGNGGNGNWDGTTGTPTFMTLALGDLPAGTYDWTSFHHDTENVHGPFGVWLSTDGGSNFNQLPDGVMSSGSTGGNPANPNLVSDITGMALAGSIYSASFDANGTDDVVLQFAPYSAVAVHRQIWGINGFQLSQVPEPTSGALLAVASLCLLGFRRRN